MWKRVKNRVQGRVTRFRVPGGAAPAEADAHRQADPVYDDRSMPIAASILWKPIDGAAEEGAGLPPIFITQRALAAVHDHCAATRAACFGLLIGDVVNSPETGAPYVVVESTIRLPGSPDEDAKTVLVQGWVVAQDVLRKSGDLLVGWYRGGGGEGEGRWASYARVGRIARWTAYAAAGVVGVAGLLRLYSAGAAPASRRSDPGSPAAVAATSLEPVDRAADTLALAIAAFDLRAQLFASRQMQCPELARGLILVEERWTTYNSVRKENGAPLDSARTARDGALYTDVDGVERRFERSACPRP